jgi:RND family efflux transporter MFP subunit
LNRSFPGKVARFADKLSLATRTMDTEVDVPNPSLVLIPGMYAEVKLTLEQHNSAIAVPVMAVDIDPDHPLRGQVMVVTPDNRVAIRKVRLGIETANRIEVRSGLRGGEMVVLSGRTSLQPGTEVRPKVSTLTAVADS